MTGGSTGSDGRSQPRVIGSAGGLAIVAGSMLGIGIFLTPPQVATHLPSPWLYLLAWLFGGIIAFSGAVAYAELGTRFPEAGGDFVFLREAFGPSLSFAAGWVLFIGVFTGSVATMAVPLAQFQLPLLAAPAFEIDPGRILFRLAFLELTVARAIGIGIIVFLTFLNILGTRLSTGAQVALTAIPVGLLSIGAIFVFATTAGAEAAVTTPMESSPVVGFGRAVLAVYFAYAGWNAIAYVGGEMKEPGETIPVSLLGGTAIITALYLLLAGCFLFVLGIEGVQQAFEIGTATASSVGGQTTTYIVTALIAVALLGSLNGTVLAGGRVALAMARRGALASPIGTLHQRFQTPARALVLQGLLASLFVLTGTFEVLLELTSVAMLVMGGLTMIALFRIRRRDGAQAPYQATFYPVLPLFFLLTSIAVIGATIFRAISGDDAFSADSLYPLLGLTIFVGTWLLHAVLRRPTKSRP